MSKKNILISFYIKDKIYLIEYKFVLGDMVLHENVQFNKSVFKFNFYYTNLDSAN